MSLVAFGAGGWEYPEREIAGGLDDYHAGRGEAPGEWIGSGAAAIGLVGRVDREQLSRLFEEARHPLSGEQLGRPHQSFSDRQARFGFGLTFSAPKSVSTLWAIAGSAVTAEVRAAHGGGADGVVVPRVARGVAPQGQGRRVAGRHRRGSAPPRKSIARLAPRIRSSTPTILVANRVRCSDDAWRSLDARELYGCQKAAGGAYQAALRVELTGRLGVRRTPPDTNGQAEIVGVPAKLCEDFSTRRRQVEVAGAARGAEREIELGRSLTRDELAGEYQRPLTSPARRRTTPASPTLPWWPGGRPKLPAPDWARTVGWVPLSARSPGG